MFTEIKNNAYPKKRTNLCKIAGGAGVLLVLLFAIGNIPLSKKPSRLPPNDIHQEALRHMAQANMQSLPSAPTQQASLPPAPVSAMTNTQEQADMDILYNIKNMINKAPLNDLLAEADKLSPNLRKMVKDKLEKISQNDGSNAEQSGGLQKNTSATLPDTGKSFSIDNVAGKDLLSSGGIHVPVPGGGVKDFGLQ